MCVYNFGKDEALVCEVRVVVTARSQHVARFIATHHGEEKTYFPGPDGTSLVDALKKLLAVTEVMMEYY